MSLSLFNAIPIEVQNDEEDRPWFKRAHVGKFLGLKHIHTSLEGLDSAESKSRSVFRPTCRTTASWSGPKGEQNKTDIFLSVYGVMHVIVNSRKSKGKILKEWVMKDVVPRGLNQIIAEKQGMIEEKNTQLALLNDDLTIAEQNVIALEQDNLELQVEIERLTSRVVPYLEDEKKNNGIVVIQKNNGDIYPYIAICG